MTGVELIPARSLSPGDCITEIDTPAGPWYSVLSVDVDRLTVDGSLDLAHAPLPVSLQVAAQDHVLRRSSG
jgi:hypothetical protein